jgi:hypothetical protein
MVIAGLAHRDVTLLYALAAALLAASALLAVIFRGNHGILSLFLLVILTAGQVFLGFRKKR